MKNIVDVINKSWGWIGIRANKVVDINRFGNIIFEADNGEFWRICPEELYCEMIAQNKTDFEKLILEKDFRIDWEMSELVVEAENELGKLNTEQSYCLKIPAVIGGDYDRKNLGKINLEELISVSGNLGFQIKDLKDGEEVELVIK